MLQGCHLEFEERVLTWIDVDGSNFAGACKEIGERVAAAAGDDQHSIGWRQLQRFAIERGVFAAGVVNQRPQMEPMKPAFRNGHACKIVG